MSEGYFIEDLAEGMSASFAKTITEADITLFVGISGDTNPLHIDEDYAKATRFGSRIAHGMLSAGLISAVLGTRLPGPGAIYMSQTMRFRAPVRPGDTVKATATVTVIDRAKKRVTLACEAHVGATLVLDGEAMVMVPSRAAPPAGS
ncbi:MAG: MaoC family dehydratase [Parvibaculaceae bacterium]|nr:MaoC family dehydratase [Parvibaculaceae bacterium]